MPKNKRKRRLDTRFVGEKAVEKLALGGVKRGGLQKIKLRFGSWAENREKSGPKEKVVGRKR